MKTKNKICLFIVISLLSFNKSYSQFGLLATTTDQISPGSISVMGMYFGWRGNSTNSALGNAALVSNTTGYHNTAFGFNTLASNTASNNNVAIGSLALQFSLGGSNTCVGYGAGQGGPTAGASHTGIKNSAFGEGTLYSILGASGNSSFGYNSLHSNTSSDSNTAVGLNSLAYLVGGGSNSAFGYNTLFNLTSGRFNVAIGNSALTSMTTGNNNVGIGSLASLANGNNQLSIQNVIYGINMTNGSSGNVGIGVIPGAGAGGPVLAKLEVGGTLKINTVNLTTNLNTARNFLWVDADNVVKKEKINGLNNCLTLKYVPKVIDGSGNMDCSQIFDNGTSSGVGIGTNTGFTYTGTTITGQIGPAPTVGSVFKLVVNGTASGTAFIALSDQRLKKEIKLIENPLEKIAKISGYTYSWNKDYKTDRKLDDNKQAGFLAQEVLKVLPEAVIKSEDGLYGLNYNAIMPLLAEGIKAQQANIEEQQLKIAELESKLENLNRKFNQLNPGYLKSNEEYFQITPNPVTSISIVTYKINNLNERFVFVIYDLQGKLKKQYSISSATKSGQIQIRKSELGSGMYILALLSNNVEIQSKKFLIAE